MVYSNFKKLEQVTKKFGLSAYREILFTKVAPREPSSWLVETPSKAYIVLLRNEKVKSEWIVSLFSSEELPVDSEKDLAGECDFFFTRRPKGEYLESPIISIAEAKDEDMDYGIAQCAAQLYGAKLFDEKNGKTIPCLYGCATDGVQWRFMKFEDNIFYVDNKTYTDLWEVLGIWHATLNIYTQKHELTRKSLKKIKE